MFSPYHVFRSTHALPMFCPLRVAFRYFPSCFGTPDARSSSSLVDTDNAFKGEAQPLISGTDAFERTGVSNFNPVSVFRKDSLICVLNVRHFPCVLCLVLSYIRPRHDRDLCSRLPTISGHSTLCLPSSCIRVGLGCVSSNDIGAVTPHCSRPISGVTAVLRIVTECDRSSVFAFYLQPGGSSFCYDLHCCRAVQPEEEESYSCFNCK